MADEQKAHSYTQTHQVSGDVLQFTLSEDDESLRQQAAASGAGRAAKTLVKEGPIRLTLIALRQGSVLDQHVAPGPCTIQAVRGDLRIQVGGETVDLQPGRLVALNQREPHSVEAIGDGSLLLTVAMPPGVRADNQ
ncbi:MAG: cupin domain-containing protein [Dehalococcoidia bacterium]